MIHWKRDAIIGGIEPPSCSDMLRCGFYYGLLASIKRGRPEGVGAFLAIGATLGMRYSYAPIV